jgi:hypothetical protein
MHVSHKLTRSVRRRSAGTTPTARHVCSGERCWSTSCGSRPAELRCGAAKAWRALPLAAQHGRPVWLSLVAFASRHSPLFLPASSHPARLPMFATLPLQGRFDELVEQAGVKVLVDPGALMHVLGTRMDFVEDRLRQGGCRRCTGVARAHDDGGLGQQAASRQGDEGAAGAHGSWRRQRGGRTGRLAGVGNTRATSPALERLVQSGKGLQLVSLSLGGSI